MWESRAIITATNRLFLVFERSKQMQQKNAEEYVTKTISIPVNLATHRRLKLAAMKEQITLGHLTKKALLQYIADDSPRRRKVK